MKEALRFSYFNLKAMMLMMFYLSTKMNKDIYIFNQQE